MNILLISTYIGAITAIASFLYGIFKIIREIDNTKKTLDENTMYTLKLIIINKNIPLDERVECGRKYIKLGGNGAIHTIVNELEMQLYNEYKGDDKNEENRNE